MSHVTFPQTAEKDVFACARDIAPGIRFCGDQIYAIRMVDMHWRYMFSLGSCRSGIIDPQKLTSLSK